MICRSFLVHHVTNHSICQNTLSSTNHGQSLFSPYFIGFLYATLKVSIFDRSGRPSIMESAAGKLVCNYVEMLKNKSNQK